MSTMVGTQRRFLGAVMATLTGFVGAVILASPASAAPFANGSFESPVIAANSFVNFTTGQMIGPWQVTGSNVDLVSETLADASDGVQLIDLAGTAAGGVQQQFDTVVGRPYAVSYDVANRCGIQTDVRAFVNGVPVDSALLAPLAPYTTRSFNFTATGVLTAIAFDGTTGGTCGTSLDNVRVLQAAGTSPASQCTGATGHKVQFRKVTTALANEATSDLAMALPPTDPAVLARATDNGVPTINYTDGGYTVASQAGFGLLRDVGTPPLTVVAGVFGTGATADPNFIMRSSGYINVPTAGVWNFTVHGDDQFRLAIGSPPQLVSVNPTNTVDSTTTAPVFFSAPGCYYYTLQHANGPGVSSVSLSASGPGQPVTTLVGAGLLPVFQGVDNPTSCKIVAVRRAPASIDGIHDDMEVSITDLDTLGSMTATGTNATFALVGPNLPPGVGTAQIIRATKITQGSPTSWAIDVYDWNGNYKKCT